MTEGDKRWIENWKPKGYNMNIGTVKSPKWDSEMEKLKNPLVGKLLKLKYRINDAYRNRNYMNTIHDKSWVIKLISDVRENNLTKLCKEDVLKCNAMWRTYE